MRLLAAVVLVVAALALVRAESDPDFSFDDFLEAPETGNEEQQHEDETPMPWAAAGWKQDAPNEEPTEDPWAGVGSPALSVPPPSPAADEPVADVYSPPDAAATPLPAQAAPVLDEPVGVPVAYAPVEEGSSSLQHSFQHQSSVQHSFEHQLSVQHSFDQSSVQHSFEHRSSMQQSFEHHSSEHLSSEFMTAAQALHKAARSLELSGMLESLRAGGPTASRAGGPTQSSSPKKKVVPVKPPALPAKRGSTQARGSTVPSARSTNRGQPSARAASSQAAAPAQNPSFLGNLWNRIRGTPQSSGGQPSARGTGGQPSARGTSSQAAAPAQNPSFLGGLWNRIRGTPQSSGGQPSARGTSSQAATPGQSPSFLGGLWNRIRGTPATPSGQANVPAAGARPSSQTQVQTPGRATAAVRPSGATRGVTPARTANNPSGTANNPAGTANAPNAGSGLRASPAAGNALIPQGLNQQGMNFLTDNEVNPRRYRDGLYVPPLGRSGATGGIGYDFGQQSPAQIRRDWTGLLPNNEVNELTQLAGKHRGAAVAEIPRIGPAVHIPYNVANEELRMRSLPNYMGQARNLLGPTRWNALTDNQRAALTDEIYNRGGGGLTMGSPYGSIQGAVRNGQLNNVPLILQYQGQHEPASLARRRDAEAALFRAPSSGSGQ